MAAFNGMIPTNKGRNLIAKSIGGAQLLFTRVTIGDGTLTSQSIPAMTALISPKLNLPIKGVRYQNPAKTVVRAELSNQDVTTGFYFREVGLFAQDPDEGEILFAYANSGSGSAEYIPPAGGPDALIRIINVNIATGQASNVAVSVDQSVVYATQQDLEDAIKSIVIEDASLTKKGIVQLDNTVGGSSSVDKAVVPKALLDSLALKQDVLRLVDNFVPASKLINDTTAPVYPNGVSMFKVSSASGGWPAANGYVLTFRAGSGGYQIFYEMYTGNVQTEKTARQWTRSKRDSNTFWQDWARSLTEIDYTALQKYVDDKTWQKHKLTEDNGASKNISGQDLNNILTAGFYDGNSLINSPVNSPNDWWYIQVERHSNSADFAVQIARRLVGGSNSPQYYQRMRISGTWQPWSEDLFTSVVNGKNDVKQVTLQKGGVVSQAGSVPTFAELVAGINTLGRAGISDIATGGNLGTVGQTLTLFTAPPNVNSFMTFTPRSGQGSWPFSYITTDTNFYLVANGVEKMLAPPNAGNINIGSLMIDLKNKRAIMASPGNGVALTSLSDLNLTGSLVLIARKVANGGVTSSVVFNVVVTYA